MMPSYTIKVKWGKEVFNDVEVNTDEEPMVFKAQLFALTGVQPERQKVMLKGAILDQSWDKMKLKNGGKLCSKSSLHITFLSGSHDVDDGDEGRGHAHPAGREDQVCGGHGRERA